MIRTFALFLFLALTFTPLISAHLHHSHAVTPIKPVVAHTQHDITRAVHAVHKMQPHALTCDSCQSMWGTVIGILGNNATYPTILAFLDSLCANLGPTYAPFCDQLASTLITVLPKAMHYIHILNIDDPQAVCSIAAVCTVTCCTDNAPQQTHIALTGDMSQMQVTWVTLSPTPTSTVMWSDFRANLSSQTTGMSYTYTQGGWLGTIHTATMTSLTPNTTYYYQVGDASQGWSQIFSFRTLPAAREAPVRYAVVGDLGVVEGTDTINDLIASANNGEFDVILHIGDISYANGYMKLWDDFFREIEPVAARIPYMVVPGNHELPFNFTSYVSRFPMPAITSGSQTNLYYSIDIGSVHFIGVDTESVINTPEITDRQLAWLRADLTAAQQRRASGTPGWIIVYQHRPLYCSNNDDEGNCGIWAKYLQSKLEDLYYNNHVDLILAGHQHDYERMHPMYQSTVNLAGPVHIINGAGGNREGVEADYVEPAPSWSAFRNNEWGWGLLTVNSPTDMEWIFQASKGNTIHDQYTFKSRN